MKRYTDNFFVWAAITIPLLFVLISLVEIANAAFGGCK